MRHLWIVVLIILSCAREQESNATSGDNLQVGNKLFDAFNKHDWKAMAALYSDSAKFLDPSLGIQDVVQTHQQTIDKYAGLQQAFPDVRDSIVNMFASRDQVVAEFVSLGTSPDGYKLRLPIISVLTIDHGRIIRDATYYDLENP